MKHQRDLTEYNSLVGWIQAHPEGIWNAFGTPPLYKDYDLNRLIDYIDKGINEDDIHISDEKKDEVFGTIRRNGNNVKRTLEYIKNLFLKGAGLSLNNK